MGKRRSLADRIQARFDSIPQPASYPHLTQHPVSARDRRVKRFVLISLAIFAFGMSFMLMTYGVAAGIWWKESSAATCTVNETSHHDTYGKSGFLGVVYDVDTTCGPLQVTGGGALSEKEAETLGESIRSGNEYQLELRGWIGWPNERKAIVAATGVTRQ